MAPILPNFAPMETVLIIGTGRMAQHLGRALHGSGRCLAGVAGRNLGHARQLAERLGCQGYALNGPLPSADLRVLAVSDDAIGAVAAALPDDGTPVVHLSGTRPLDLLLPHARRGVMWPVQSFSPGTPVDFAEVPVVIDAADAATLNQLERLAASLSGTIVRVDAEQRQRLHLCAVLTSNFPAFLLREAQRLLTTHGMDPQLLLPLWRATAQKAAQHADLSVTGPARRGDTGTMAAHLRLLEDEPELRRAYAAISDLILHTYHPQPRDPQDL